MKIILRRRVTGFGQDAEQAVRSALALIINIIQIESVEVKKENNHGMHESQLITVNYRSQGMGMPGEDANLESLVKRAIRMSSDLEFVRMDIPMSLRDARFDNPYAYSDTDDETIFDLTGFGRAKEKRNDINGTYYVPAFVRSVKEASYTHKTTITFSLEFHPVTFADDKALAIRTTLFNEVFKCVGTPCLNHREKYGRDIMGKVVVLDCSLEFVTNNVDEKTLRDRLVELQKTMPGTIFLNDGIKINHVAVEPTLIHVSPKPLKVLQEWDNRALQSSSQSFFEADANAMQSKKCNTTRCERNVFQNITAITFDYERPQVDVCKLAPLAQLAPPLPPSSTEESVLTTVSSQFFKRHQELSPKNFRKHPQADGVLFVLFKPEKSAEAKELKETLSAAGLHAYTAETPKTGQTAVSVNLKKSK
jgi:hypothetical protein